MALSRTLYAAVLATVAASAHASIIANGGATDVLVAGAGVGYTADFFGDPTLVIHGWDEVQNFTLTSNLDVDITTFGTFNSAGSLTPGTIAAGTTISSHAFYYDPAGGGTTGGGFQFDGTIVGVILDEGPPMDHLLDSDFLIPGSVPLANIPTAHFDARGMELGINIDNIVVNAHTIQLSLSAGSPGDQIRVLTVVPEPASMTTAMVVGMLAMLRRRRSS